MFLIPLNKCVVVHRLDPEGMSAGGIVIPEETQKKQKPQRGKVIEVGESFEDDNGHVWRSRFIVGDLIFFPKYEGEEVELPDGQKILFIKESAILGVARETRGTELKVVAS